MPKPRAKPRGSRRGGIPLLPPSWDFDFCNVPPAQRANRAAHFHFLAPAPHRNVPPPPRLPRTIQQAPSLPVFLKSSPRRSRIEPQRGQPLRHLDRNDVPQILRHNMHHHEIHVFLRERPTRASRSHLIFRPLIIRPALHLHPPKPFPPIHHKIVAFAVSPRLAYRNPQPANLSQKSRLHRLPHPLVLSSATACRSITSFSCSSPELLFFSSINRKGTARRLRLMDAPL